jgi:flagellar motor switch protein FliN/FliY
MNTPLSWLRRIAGELPELNTVPLFGNSPPFDWSFFSSKLATRFGFAQMKIEPKEEIWREFSAIKKGLKVDTQILSINIAPLGNVYWLMSHEDLIKWTTYLMKPSQKPRAPFSEIFQEGFYRFTAFQILDALQELKPFSELSLQINEEEFLEPNKAFCIDIEIDLDTKSCWGRLVIPEEMRSKWIQHFSHLQRDYFPKEIAKQTYLDLSLKTGSVVLSREEWAEIQIGDFVLLDQGSYDAHKGTGVSLMMLGKTAVFNAKIKQGRVELIDYAFYYEDNMEKTEEMASLKEMPLHVTVEIARLKMTLDKLMHLSPGNTLELPVHPDQGVSLTVNGQVVGRAELVYLGEQLGIRILEI